MIGEESLLLESKATVGLAEEHEVQPLNELKALDIEIDLLLNSGLNPEIKPEAYDNEDK